MIDSYEFLVAEENWAVAVGMPGLVTGHIGEGAQLLPEEAIRMAQALTDAAA